VSAELLSLDLPTITPWTRQQLTLPFLRQYGSLIKQYSIRQLSRPEDAMAAFSGVTTRLSDVFKEGFLWGLPLEFFEAALLWQPVYSLTK
jgi:hypothetical protein